MILALPDASHLYWANVHTIAKATLTGAGIVQRLIRTHGPYLLAVSRNH